MEGFWTNPKTHEIQSKPAQDWTEEDILHVEPLYYTLACSLSLQNCAFFLLQAFWSYISKSVTKSSFMSSFEFKFYVVASCGVVVLFPTIQYLFRNDFVYREVVPHLIFCILLFTAGALGMRVHFRLVALIKSASASLNETSLNVLEKLEYFKDMVRILLSKEGYLPFTSLLVNCVAPVENDIRNIRLKYRCFYYLHPDYFFLCLAGFY